MAGPSLAGVGTARRSRSSRRPTTRARRRMRRAISASPSRSRAPTSCPGAMYSANGVSFMPNTYGKDLSPGADRAARRLSGYAQIAATGSSPDAISSSQVRRLLVLRRGDGAVRTAAGVRAAVGRQVPRPRSAALHPALRRHEGHPHEPADRVGAHRLHGRDLLDGARRVAHRAAQRQARLRSARCCGC